MKTKIQIIKQKFQNFPILILPRHEFPYILETCASNEVWARFFMQKHAIREEVFSYASGCFNDTKLTYPSSQK